MLVVETLQLTDDSTADESSCQFTQVKERPQSSGRAIKHLQHNLPDSASEIQETPGADIEETQVNEIKETPGVDIEETLGAEIEETPGAEIEETPGAEIEETPSAEIEETPGAEIEETPGAEIEKTPADITCKVENNNMNATLCVDSFAEVMETNDVTGHAQALDVSNG